MYPYINMGFMELPTYLVIFSIGYVLMTLRACQVGTEYGYNKRDIVGVSVYAAVGLVIGAKLLYFISIIPDAITRYTELKKMWELASIEVINYLFGGMVYYGGLFGTILGAYFYSRQHFIPYAPMMNMYAPLIPFVHAFGRVGCFMAGCCYGIEYSGLGCVQFPGEDISRIPVQLIEAVLNLIIAVVLEWLRHKKDSGKDGTLLGIYFVYYSVIRFVLEFFRGDQIRGGIGLLSTSQIISLLLLPVGIMLIQGKHYKKKEV